MIEVIRVEVVELIIVEPDLELPRDTSVELPVVEPDIEVNRVDAVMEVSVSMRSFSSVVMSFWSPADVCVCVSAGVGGCASGSGDHWSLSRMPSAKAPGFAMQKSRSSPAVRQSADTSHRKSCAPPRSQLLSARPATHSAVQWSPCTNLWRFPGSQDQAFIQNRRWDKNLIYYQN